MSEADPVAVVQQQLDAYNARDIEAFLSVFADDAERFALNEAQPMLSGKAAFRERYGWIFAQSPDLHAELVHRIAVGDFVIDHEHITGWLGDPGVLEMVMLFQVRDGLIVQSHVVRAG